MENRVRRPQRFNKKSYFQRLNLKAYNLDCFYYDLWKLVLALLSFMKSSIYLINRCSKPSRQEFRRTLLAIASGFLVMGLMGYFVKLLHIPINNFIMS